MGNFVMRLVLFWRVIFSAVIIIIVIIIILMLG